MPPPSNIPSVKLNACMNNRIWISMHQHTTSKLGNKWNWKIILPISSNSDGKDHMQLPMSVSLALTSWWNPPANVSTTLSMKRNNGTVTCSLAPTNWRQCHLLIWWNPSIHASPRREWVVLCLALHPINQPRTLTLIDLNQLHFPSLTIAMHFSS